MASFLLKRVAEWGQVSGGMVTCPRLPAGWRPVWAAGFPIAPAAHAARALPAAGVDERGVAGRGGSAERGLHKWYGFYEWHFSKICGEKNFLNLKQGQ